ncbi:MAG: PTS mannose transporter subunit IIC [Chloroflexi bacterium]|nr:PTS mannose transporter subunit IIC [Chloroflexota bacterium]
MTNIVIAGHGDLAEALLRTAELICGPAEGVLTVSLLANEEPASFDARLTAALSRVEGDDTDTLVLVDLLGGTPYNVAARWLLRANVECVTGVNLPMLLEILTARESVPLPQLAALAVRHGRDAIVNLGPMLGKRG